MKEKLQRRKSLDRRRLEEAFLLYAVLKVHFAYDLNVDHIDHDRNVLVQKVTETFRERFLEKWSGHRCKVKGCGSIIVLDGNMKNARTVCSCNNVGEIIFDRIGSVLIGCPNTPGKGIRYCPSHEGLARKYVDDKNAMENEGGKGSSTDEDLMIIKILSNKLTRQGNFCEVEWCNGVTSWIKESNLPPNLRGLKVKNVVKVVDVVEFGKKLRFLVKDENYEKNNNTKKMQNNGFGIADKEDDMVEEGCLAFQWPCGIVISIAEMFNCESKSQVYGYLHEIMQEDNMSTVRTICYDDACHLLRYAQNPKRLNLTDTSKRIGGTTIVVDKFHFRNHVDEWCKKHCNPYKCTDLDEVNHFI
ncbi:Hypothetical predicted protein [Paramuricea clavata]|uniref:Uncharacterized protein n=1 Tax=Paramuricea clavata TaxID=317549 RepID=A0A7D9HGH5_PARCT|nr:Hypothetical predicted protein [Paramuricea clavata]